MREITVRSLGELIDRVTPERPDERTGRRRDTGVYRGASDAERSLLTSLDRLGGVDPPHTKRDLESHILRNYIRYSRPHFPNVRPSDWESLVSAQHHGVPTRLLDWSYSPLVAAHFATADPRAGGDRAVWRLEWQEVHRKFDLPTLALLIEDLESTFGSGGNPFTPWRMIEGNGIRGAFACMLEPPSLDARIVAQSAVFTLCSDVTRSFDDFLARQGLTDVLTRVAIPEGEVSRIRDQLDLVGMDERRLFPDLDGVAAQLRRYYS
jgi:hypothetical protein